MGNNRLIIAAAGSGKTTFLIKEALKKSKERILITTYTQSNEEEIHKKFIEVNKCIPGNITIQTWFSFLLKHGVRPFQDCLFDKRINGLLLVSCQSAVKYKMNNGIPVYYREEDELEQHYFTENHKIYSDKLSKFVFKCNELSNGSVIDRLSRIYSHIYIDEVQDLAGYDLEILKLLFISKSHVLMVGDHRQVIYLTHHERKHERYSNGLIKEFIHNECKKIQCEIDEISLNVSYRNNQKICDFSARLFPNYNSCKSNKNNKTEHDGVFLIKEKDVEKYLKKYKPVQLRLNKEVRGIYKNYRVLNFGESKGLSFDRVLIFPTKDMSKWLINNKQNLATKTRSQFYVAITRAKYSVGIIYNYCDDANIDGVTKYKFE